MRKFRLKYFLTGSFAGPGPTPCSACEAIFQTWSTYSRSSTNISEDDLDNGVTFERLAEYKAKGVIRRLVREGRR